MMDINNKDKHALEPFDTTKYGKEMSSHHQISSVLWYNVLATFVKGHCLHQQRSTKKCNDRVHLAKDFALVSFLSADFSAFVGICKARGD